MRHGMMITARSEFESALGQFEALIPLRNKLVHGLWSETDDPEIARMSLVKSRGSVRHQSEFINLPYLEWLTRQMERATTLLFNFGLNHNLIKTDR
jgi:hypothetical protein